MNRRPMVSVIIIFLNAEKYLDEAVQSVLSQTYTDWELVLADDGSTDGSTAKALQYAEQFPAKIRYVEHAGHRNRGMSATRNLGLTHAKGDFIAFLDADDRWLPQKLERQMAVLAAQPDTAMAYGPVEFWYGWTGDPQHAQQDYIQDVGVPVNTVVQSPRLLSLFLQNEGFAPCMGSFVIRRTVVDKVHGFEETFRGMYEDQVFLSKVCLEAAVFVESKPTCKVRVHQASCCSVTDQAGSYHASRLRFLNWLETFVQDKRITERTIRKRLRMELRPYRFPIWHQLVRRLRKVKSRFKRMLKWIGIRTLPGFVLDFLRSSKNGVPHTMSVPPQKP